MRPCWLHLSTFAEFTDPCCASAEVCSEHLTARAGTKQASSARMSLDKLAATATTATTATTASRIKEIYINRTPAPPLVVLWMSLYTATPAAGGNGCMAARLYAAVATAGCGPSGKGETLAAASWLAAGG